MHRFTGLFRSTDTTPKNASTLNQQQSNSLQQQHTSTKDSQQKGGWWPFNRSNAASNTTSNSVSSGNNVKTYNNGTQSIQTLQPQHEQYETVVFKMPPCDPKLQSITQTKRIRRFARFISSANIDIHELSQQTWLGVPNPYRSVVWSYLLNYIPTTLTSTQPNHKRLQSLLRKRTEYAKSVYTSYYCAGHHKTIEYQYPLYRHQRDHPEYYTNSIPQTAPETTNNNITTPTTDDTRLRNSMQPLNNFTTPPLLSPMFGGPATNTPFPQFNIGSVNLPSQQAGQNPSISPSDKQLLHQIRIDLPRTLTTYHVIQLPQIQAMLERILFTWALRHPTASYVQGMNDLCAMIVLIVLEQTMWSRVGMCNGYLDVVNYKTQLIDPPAPPESTLNKHSEYSQPQQHHINSNNDMFSMYQSEPPINNFNQAFFDIHLHHHAFSWLFYLSELSSKALERINTPDDRLLHNYTSNVYAVNQQHHSPPSIHENSPATPLSPQKSSDELILADIKDNNNDFNYIPDENEDLSKLQQEFLKLAEERQKTLAEVLYIPKTQHIFNHPTIFDPSTSRSTSTHTQHQRHENNPDGHNNDSVDQTSQQIHTNQMPSLDLSILPPLYKRITTTYHIKNRSQIGIDSRRNSTTLQDSFSSTNTIPSNPSNQPSSIYIASASAGDRHIDPSSLTIDIDVCDEDFSQAQQTQLNISLCQQQEHLKQQQLLQQQHAFKPPPSISMGDLIPDLPPLGTPTTTITHSISPQTAIHALNHILCPETISMIECDVYWLFTLLIDMVQDNYITKQPGIHRMLHKFETLITQIDPILCRWLVNDNHLVMIQFAFRWFNCLFVRELPFQYSARLWDVALSNLHTNTIKNSTGTSNRDRLTSSRGSEGTSYTTDLTFIPGSGQYNNFNNSGAHTGSDGNNPQNDFNILPGNNSNHYNPDEISLVSNHDGDNNSDGTGGKKSELVNIQAFEDCFVYFAASLLTFFRALFLAGKNTASLRQHEDHMFLDDSHDKQNNNGDGNNESTYGYTLGLYSFWNGYDNNNNNTDDSPNSFTNTNYNPNHNAPTHENNLQDEFFFDNNITDIIDTPSIYYYHLAGVPFHVLIHTGLSSSLQSPINIVHTSSVATNTSLSNINNSHNPTTFPSILTPADIKLFSSNGGPNSQNNNYDDIVCHNPSMYYNIEAICHSVYRHHVDCVHNHQHNNGTENLTITLMQPDPFNLDAIATAITITSAGIVSSHNVSLITSNECEINSKGKETKSALSPLSTASSTAQEIINNVGYRQLELPQKWCLDNFGDIIIFIQQHLPTVTTSLWHNEDLDHCLSKMFVLQSKYSYSIPRKQ